MESNSIRIEPWSFVNDIELCVNNIMFNILHSQNVIFNTHGWLNKQDYQTMIVCYICNKLFANKNNRDLFTLI